MTKKNEIAATTTGQMAIATTAPDFMKQDAGRGTENIRAEDTKVPRLVLLQSLSPEVTEGDQQAGSLYHNVMEKPLAGRGEKLKIVVIHTEIKYMLWRPRHEGGGILARASLGKDGQYHWSPANTEFQIKPEKNKARTVTWNTKDTVANSRLDQFGTYDPESADSLPAAVKMWNFLVVLPDFPELGPMVLTLQKGGAKTAASFSGKLKSERGAPSFGQVFEVSSKMVDTGSGDFHDLVFERIGFVSDVNEYNMYEQMNKTFAEHGIEIRDEESAQEDSGTKAKPQAPNTKIEM